MNDFEKLYREQAPRVLAFCLRRGPREMAEDATAETFAVAWRRRDDMPSEPGPWLLGVARRTLANQRRSAQRQQAVANRLALEAESTLAATPLGGAPVIEALARLPERDREVLMLSAWDGLRAAEAAKVLGCSAAAFRIRLHRARRQLARRLEQIDQAASGAGQGAPGMKLKPEETSS